MPFVSQTLVPIAASGLVELMLFLTVWDELDQSLSWRAAAESLDILYERLKSGFLSNVHPFNWSCRLRRCNGNRSTCALFHIRSRDAKLG